MLTLAVRPDDEVALKFREAQILARKEEQPVKVMIVTVESPADNFEEKQAFDTEVVATPDSQYEFLVSEYHSRWLTPNLNPRYFFKKTAA
jgi:hypothetical protein